MWLETLLAYLHFLLAFAIVASLTIETVLLRGEPDRNAVDLLSRADMGFFCAAALMLLSGGALWGFSSKGLAFHAGNTIFWLKLLVVAAIGLLSMLPATRYGRWRRLAHLDPAHRVSPAEALSVRRILFVQLALLALIPLLAALAARGIGF